MKRLGISISSFCVALTLLLCSVASAFAEEETSGESAQGDLTINGDAKVKVGDIVTYTLYLSEAVEPIVGFELRLFYDADFLEYQKSSLQFEKFDVVIYNEEIEGKIPMNCSSLTSLPSFKEKAQFLSADFKVTQGGDAKISYFFTELYGENMEYLKRYKLTCDIKVGDKTIVKDATPLVNDDESTLTNNQGDFINYADGMGEENSPQKDDAHVKVGSAVMNKIVEVTRTVEGTNAKSSGGFFGSFWFVLLVGVLILGAVVAGVVIMSAKKKGNNSVDS